MTNERHSWSVSDEKAALNAYLKKLSKNEAGAIAKSLGIEVDSFLMRMSNFQYLDEGKGFYKSSEQTKRIWDDYKRTGIV